MDNYSNASFLRIYLKTSKTDPFCKGTDILLGRTRDELCPVAALLQWMVQWGNAPGPLFKFVSGVPLTRPLLVSRLCTFIQQMGGDTSGFSGHSFRSGVATTAAQLGISDSQIKLLGRWKSNACTPISSALGRLEQHLVNRYHLRKASLRKFNSRSVTIRLFGGYHQ